MKRFDIITEADARGLEIGTSVALRPGGHITPLALDTLARARKVTVVRDVVDADLASLVPVGDIRRVAIGSDHSGLQLKSALRDDLRAQGLAVEDVGTDSTEPVDYPDIAAPGGAAGRAQRSRRGHRHRRRRAGLGDCGQQDRRRARGDVHRLARWPAMRASTTAPTCWRSAPRSSASRRQGHRRDVSRDADARGALHPPACQDPEPRTNAIECLAAQS